MAHGCRCTARRACSTGSAGWSPTSTSTRSSTCIRCQAVTGWGRSPSPDCRCRTTCPTPHVRLEADGVALAYTGDTGPAPALAELGRDADLFIVEATDRDGEADRPVRNLLASTEAGHWARRACARRLMLTHFWPGNDRAASVAAAREEFGGEVLAAEEGLSVPLGEKRSVSR